MQEKRDLETASREQKLKETSGNVVLSDSLATFLYLLMRDHLPAGKVELLIQAVIDGAEKITFHNGYLAQYASNLADELRDGRFKVLVEALDAAFTDHTRMGAPTKVPDSNTIPAKLELTSEATTLIEKAYEELTEEARKQAELELETGESAEVKELTEEMGNALADEPAELGSNEQLTDKLKEQIVRIRQATDTPSNVKVEEQTTDTVPTIFDDNDLSNPFSPASLRKKAEAAKPQETQLQKRQREAGPVETNKEFNETVREQAINSALMAIEKLKTLVPNETVVEVAKVLRDEIEHELSMNKKVQEITENKVLETVPDTTTKSAGVFRRVKPEDFDINADSGNSSADTLIQAMAGEIRKSSNNLSKGAAEFARGEPELQLDEGQIVFVERTDDGRQSNTKE